jgi:tetratricopeptide (TPR) repeat protein
MASRAKTGRNDPCPCGSGRKFKACHGGVEAPEKAGASPSRSIDPLLAEAEKLLTARRFDDAIRVLLEAARVAPEHPTVHANLGAAYLVTRRLADAIDHLRRSIAARPGFARAHHNLGLALQQSGKDDEALEAFKRAVLLGPDLAEAHGRVGDLEWEKGRRDEAAAAYERAFAAAPETTLGRLSKAKARLIQGRAREAEEVLEDVLARDASSGEAHLVLAHLQNDAGRFGEAAAHYERSIAVAPKQATAYQGIVSSRRMTEEDRPLLARILERIEARDLGDRQEMTLQFAAGKAFDDLRDYASAIRHFDAANAIRRRLAPFDRGPHERRVDGLLARFTPDLFARRPAAPDRDDETPLLILGMPRSGTTLIERMVSSHPEVKGGGELGFWRQRGPVCSEIDIEKLLQGVDAIRGDYLRVLRALSPDALRVTDKMPFNYLWIGLVHLVLPRARIVHCRRNALDTCLSIYTTQFGQNWGFASDRGDLAFHYRQYERLMDHWRKVIDAERLLEIDYEEATAAPEDAARKLVAFAGLAWDPACSRPESNPDAIQTSSKWQARQPVYRSSVERWRRYEPWLGELGALRD